MTSFEINIFYNSIIDSSEDIVIIVNKTRVINLTTKPYHWHIRPLGVFDEINHVSVDNSQKVIYDKTFDNEFREIFKIKFKIYDFKYKLSDQFKIHCMIETLQKAFKKSAFLKRHLNKRSKKTPKTPKPINNRLSAFSALKYFITGFILQKVKVQIAI